jgi:hypothetical protein
MEVLQFYKYPRTILIAYTYDALNKIIQYGATIHTENSIDPNDLYDRQKHLAKALERYNTSPRVIQIDLDNITLEEKEKQIRNLLPIYGCG